jgi:hypothetical protein
VLVPTVLGWPYTMVKLRTSSQTTIRSPRGTATMREAGSLPECDTAAVRDLFGAHRPGQARMPQVLEPCARRAFFIITELTAMTLSDSAASRVPSSTRSSRSGVAFPSSRCRRASLAEIRASCRARCTPIVVGSLLLTSLLCNPSGACSPRTSSRSLRARIRKRRNWFRPATVTADDRRDHGTFIVRSFGGYR